MDIAGMAELVYALVLGTSVARLGGSSPPPSTREVSKLLCLRGGIERIFHVLFTKPENHLAM